MNIFKIFAFGLLLLLVGGVYVVVERPMPQLSGTLYVEGLKDRVEVIRDRWGVPHIYAQNEEDLFFAQGYVTAQDRLWQMDLNRRAGHGRLSEIFGKVALKADKAVRTLGLHRFAKASAQNLSPWARQIVEAYARGVNAFISAHRDRLPLEFMILGYKPEPWTVEDTIAVFAPLAQILQSNMYDQIRRARALMVLGEEKFKELELELDYSTEGTFLIDANGQGMIASQSKALHPSMLPSIQLKPQTLEALEAFAADYAAVARLTPDAAEALGSNNWVVSGTLTNTGKPYLANDVHLEPQQPGHFYEVHLNGPGWNVIGVSVPGIPGVALGHNERIAWGATAATLAVQDLFVERFNPDNPSQYEYQGRWEEVQVVREEIRVRGEREPVVHEVLITRHGPVVTELFRDYPERVALSWALLAKDTSIDGLLMLNRARNWEEFRQAVSQWGLDLNFVYADVESNIGYQMSGRVPRRPKGYTGLPVPGWTGEHDWDGFIPFEQLPHALNPKTHFVATANHRTVAKEYQPEIPGEWQVPFRARRIVQLLRSKGRFTLEDMRAMQANSYSEIYHQLAQLLVAHVQPASKREQQALDYLRTWDGVIREENVAPSIIRETFGELIERTFIRKLGQAASFIGRNEGIYLFLKLAKENPSSEWFDDPATEEREELDDMLALGFKAALEDLTKAHGAEMSRWQWGKLVAKRKFQHPLSGAPLMSVLCDRSASCSCGGHSLNAGHNTAWRALIDLADLDNSRSGLPTGQAGHPFSKHYSDQLQAWRMVQPHPMLWERASIERHQEAVLILLPK